MTTFNITNIAPDLQKMTMTVFYKFSTGDVFSNTVPATTPVPEILQWGQDKCTWFDERAVMIAETQKELLEQPVVEVVEEIIEE